jgi:protein tyrosine phosphatase (PTP) superfamily phosphohydrolase (DUF442 family)
MAGRISLGPDPSTTAHRVDDQIYIGGYLAAADPKFVHENGIRRIVKMFRDDDTYPGGFHRHAGVEYLVVPADDVETYDISPGAIAAMRFIKDGLRRGDRILVHCHMGISRSSTVVLLHLMLNRGMTLTGAQAHLKKLRPVVQPNAGFMRFLMATDSRLRLIRARRRAVERPPDGALALRLELVTEARRELEKKPSETSPSKKTWTFQETK